MADDATSTTDAAAGTDTGTAATDTTTAADADSTIAEIKALADELGITPGQLKGRLEASKKWEQRAKANTDAATKATTQAQSAQQQLQAVAKALGIDTGDDLTPEKLQAQLAERDKHVAERDGLIADMQRERQAEKAARHHKADVDLLMPALTYHGLLDDIDPTDDDFAAKVDQIVGKFVENNPKYLAAAGFPDLRQGNQGQGAAASNDPNAWLRNMAGRA